MPSLEARGIWFRYSRIDGYVLRGAELYASPGDTVAIVGPMGSGKTTLLMILAGLLNPEKGVVKLGSTIITGGEPQARRLVGIVFQDPDEQLFNPTVYGELAYALRTMGLGEDEIKERVGMVAESLSIKDLLGRPPHRLSYGQKKLVALASVLVYEPYLLLLDEPTTNLDKDSFEKVLRIINKYRAENRIVVITTHDIDTVIRASTKLCVLSNGVLGCNNTWDMLGKGLDALPVPVPISLEVLLQREGNWKKVAVTLRRIIGSQSY